MPQLNIYLLGTVVFDIDGILLKFATQKAAALFIYLVVTNKPQSREFLATFFWPESNQSRAKASLRQELLNIKNKIGAERLIVNSQEIQFHNGPNCIIDTDEFQELRSSIEAANVSLEYCEKILSLYRGDFLNGFFVKNCPSFNEWLLFERDSLRDSFVSLLEIAIKACQLKGTFEKSILFSRHLVALDPLHEPAQILLLESYIQSGQQKAALQQFEALALLLHKELKVKPSPEIVAVVDRAREAGNKRPNNLPRLTDQLSFVGRHTEISEIRRRLLDSKTRLLTICGMGGVGKTKLMLQFATIALKQHFGPFFDGMFFVPLPAIWNEGQKVSRIQFASSIAKALNLELIASLPVEDQLLKTVKGNKCLIMIDNAESLDSQGRRLISHILNVAAHVKILATSREEMNLQLESLLHLEGLPYAEERTLNDDAYKVFERHAQQSNPNFSLNAIAQDEDERAAIVDLCKITQGYPLALELAAVWAHIINCQELVEEIKVELNLLSTDSHDVDDRHRSMRAVFNQSWDRLGKDEKQLLMCLGIFANVFDYAAAKEIAAASSKLLKLLHEKSLLQVLSTGSHRRYRLHPLLRQFVFEKLKSEPFQLETLKATHAFYYGAFLEKKEGRLHGKERSSVLDEIEEWIDDILVGWNWAVEKERLDLIYQYHACVMRFYNWRGWWHAASALFEKLLEIRPSQKKKTIDYKALDVHHEESNDELLIEDQVKWTDILVLTSINAIQLGDIDLAVELLTECRSMVHSSETAHQLITVYRTLGTIYQKHGDYEQAEQNYMFGLQVAAGSDDTQAKVASDNVVNETANTLMAFGSSARDRGEYSQARSLLEKSIFKFNEVGSEWGKMHALRLLGGVIAKQGEIDVGESFISESLSLALEADDSIALALAYQQLGQANLQKKAFARADQYLQKSLESFRELNDRKGIALVLKSLADLSAEKSDYELAVKRYQESFQNATAFKDLPLTLDILLGIGNLESSGVPASHFESAKLNLIEIVYNHPSSSDRQKEKARQLLPSSTNQLLKHPSRSADSLSDVKALIDGLLPDQGNNEPAIY